MTLEALLEGLKSQGLTAAEVFAKRGRTRRIHDGPDGGQTLLAEEQGWAVRAGNKDGSFFSAGSGLPDVAGPWPRPTDGPLELPPPAAARGSAWSQPSDLDTSILAESEGVAMVRGVREALAEEKPEARLLSATIEDGWSESELRSSHGLVVRHRSRLAAIRLWAASRGDVETELSLADREARRFNPRFLARRLADRLVIAERGAAPARDRGTLLLAPEVGARLLAGLTPLFIGAAAWSGLRALCERGEQIAAPNVTLVDDGRLTGGLFEAPVDGEGVASREVTLVERGRLRQPLLPWWEDGEGDGRMSGCRRRASWRSLPQTGPTHFYLRPDPRVRVGELLSELARGYYLIAAGGPGRFLLAEGLFALPVAGFEMRSGRPASPVAKAWLVGGVVSFLRGVAACARDLSFYPYGGAIGAPSLLVTGLEIRDRSPLPPL